MEQAVISQGSDLNPTVAAGYRHFIGGEGCSYQLLDVILPDTPEGYFKDNYPLLNALHVLNNDPEVLEVGWKIGDAEYVLRRP